MPDFKSCSPIPGVPTDACEITENQVPGLAAKCEINRGAACNNFLTSNPQLLDAAGWDQQIQTWINAGLAVECTDSGSLAAIKAAIEKLCSKFPCTGPQAQAAKAIAKGIDKMLAVGRLSQNVRGETWIAH